jgi:hypothetical protein
MVNDMMMKRLFLTMAALACGMFAAPEARAGHICGASGSSVAQSIDYDPFSPLGLATTSITLTMTRVNNGGGSFTKDVRFYLRAQSAGANGTVIEATGVTGPANVAGTGLNIFYNNTAAPPTLTGTPSASNRFLQIDFTGNNAASDSVQVHFKITLPANLDIQATQNLAFDAVFTCTANPSTTESGIISNAVVFPIRVLSGLRASYVGAPLDFGEVGDKTTLQVAAAPGTYTTPATNSIRVESSGPYKVQVSSLQNYRLTFPGGNLATPDHTLNYKVRFLNQTLSNATPVFVPVTCQRAGLGGANLPIYATLLEGGSGKTASANYADVITVTVSPLLSTETGQVNCPGLPLPAL